MNCSRRIKRLVGVALATCLTVSTVPVENLFSFNEGGEGIITAYASEQSEALTTTLNQTEVGTHDGTGSYVYDAENKTITIIGSGTKFDKNSGSDDFYLASYAAKGDITISAKLSVSNPTGAAAYAGIIIRNSNDESGSAGAALYADMANGNKNQIRYGYHLEETGGGASQVNSSVTTDSEDIYIKLVVSGTTATYYVSSTADFSDETTSVKTQSISDLDAKTVGFFATEGVTATFSDVTISSTNTVDGVEQNKIIFDSEVGEVMPSFSSSADYSGSYDAGNSFVTTVDGNVLNVNHTRSTTVKGNIRTDVGYNYWLFPSTTEDMTISADVTIESIDSGTDKQGLVIGQFDAISGSAMMCDVIHFQKNLVFQHTFSGVSGVGACGDPKTAALSDYAGTTYSLSYTKSGNTAYMTVKSADGTVLIDNQSFDLTQDYADLQAGQAVSYGLGFCGVVADISNVTLKNAAGDIVYDMNDYYVAVGVAPVIDTVTTSVAEDRESINLDWSLASEGSGNIKYSVYVSKDGGEYTKAGDSKTNSYSYTAMDGDGEYQFKIVPYGGDTVGEEVETEAVVYQAPLTQTELTAEATSSSATLSWTEVENATSYDIYRAEGTSGSYELLANTDQLTYTDTTVTTEEPYTYYVVAKNADNTSNPSETYQILATDGHTGTYAYEDDATEITVVSKSNDTIFDTSATMTLMADEAGTAQLSVNDTLTETKLVTADTEFTFDISDLEQGRNDIEIIFTDNDGVQTRKTFNFVSNPDYDIVVDAAYEGEDGAEVDGVPTYKTVEAAVNSVPSDNSESKIIFIKNGEYEERVTVESPYVSLLGEDAEKTHLFYSVCIANGNADSMWNRNAMYVDSTADGFTAENLTIENSYAYTNGSDQQADALCIVADETACVNIRIVGYQDTLLTDSRVKDADGNYEVTRQYFEKCYITGNVDFIYGAGTSVFEDCDIVARYTEYKSDGCYSAGRTYATTEYGYVFNNCRFLAEDGVVDGAYRMARPWGADDSTTFINCYLGRAISLDTSYGDMSGNTAANARFAEYGSYGPGFTISNSRPYLSAQEAEAFETATVLGDYDYEATVDGLYIIEPTDTTALEDCVAKVLAIILDNVTSDKYTSDSMKALAIAYDAVKNADVTSLTQDEIDALTESLNAAISGLVEKSAGTDGSDTSGSTDGTEPTGSTDGSGTEGSTDGTGTTGSTEGTATEEESDATVSLSISDEEGVVYAVEIVADAIIKDASGNTVSIDQVQIKVEASSAAATEINEALESTGITLNAGANALFYEISLTDADGNVLTLEDGTAVVRFELPDGIDYDDYDIVIYHLNDDGELEILSPNVTEDGLEVTVSSFSPFAVVYELKTDDTESSDTSDASDSNVQTGDHTRTAMYFLLSMGALAVLCGAGYESAKKKKKDTL